MKKFKPTISKEILLNDGYKIYPTKDGETLYQKKVTDKKGIKFFINCYHYQFEFDSWWEFSMQIEIENDLSVEIKTVQWFNENGIYSGKNHLH